MVISVFYIISAVLSTKFRCLVLVEEGLFELFDYLEFLNFCFLEANLFLANTVRGSVVAFDTFPPH